MDEGILSTIGNTPLVKLSRIFRDSPFELFAKLEGLNPGGSAKDRSALHIFKAAIAEGKIGPNTAIIESSSGNLGVGLAQICCYYGLRFICIVDPKTAPQNIQIIKAYGAEIDLVTEPDPITGEFLQARIDRVKALQRSIKDSFWPNQYANPANVEAHYRTTMPEIVAALDGNLDYLFCAASTCGTVRGCSEYARDHTIKVKIVAVDAVGSVIFGGEPGKRLIPGHGASRRPELFTPEMADERIHVTDLDCVVGCRRLLRKEAIHAGGSSGGVLTAIDKFKRRIQPGAVCVAILHDRGERYLDTIYSDDWVAEHFGDVSSYWSDEVEEDAQTAMTY
jgi:N-(2-amino-2-carboxyethyl)-L-glutamate synthase